jgi:hypothetical protein
MDSLDKFALGSIGAGGGWLIFQRAAMREKLDGPTTLLFGAGLLLVGGLSWFAYKSARNYAKSNIQNYLNNNTRNYVNPNNK